MKKALLTAAILTMVLGTAACSSKAGDTPATTAGTSTEAAESTTATETSEEETEADYDEVSMTGTVTAMDGDILTVKDDDDDTDKDFDLSNAEINQEFPLSEGDIVEIIYPDGTEKDPIPAISLEVYESVIGQNTDPSATGTVAEASDATLTLDLGDGESYTFTITNAYIVAANGIATGKEATVTYIGEIDDEPIATKVVMEDSYDTEEAERNAFVGKVSQIEENSIVLESAQEEFYTFTSDDIDFSQQKVGDTITIFYTGTLSGKTIAAEEIE